MVAGTCENKDCTVSETGLCLLSHKDPIQCPHFHVIAEEIMRGAPSAPVSAAGIPGEKEPTSVRQFHSGIELGTEDAAEIMRGRYVYLIGILGATNVGKTCFLSSLYLLVSNGGLKPDYLFAGSLTLQGFEDRARKVRTWKDGLLPDKLAEHTRLLDPRSPSFMHLALHQKDEQPRRIDLLLTDLPGEWSSDLVHRVETATRFNFLKRANGIILMVEGPLLASSDTRHIEVHRSKLILDRLSQAVKVDRDVPIVILVSKCDLLSEMEIPESINQVKDHAIKIGFGASIVMSASFSSKPERIESGTGVLNAIKLIIGHNTMSKIPSGVDTSFSTNRAFMRFRLPQF